MDSRKDGKEMTQPEQGHNCQRELDRLIEGLQREDHIPKLLLHDCCTPYGSYILEYLSQCFDMIVYYYNPNTFLEAKYETRVKEQECLIREVAAVRPVRFLIGSYEPEGFLSVARDHKKDPEGGKRCRRCYELRLDRAARKVASGNFDFFTTTLSISPLKNARWLNDIGCRLTSQYGIPCLVSDFKEKNGYRRSAELFALYGLYRQDYCGCAYSRAEA